MQCLLHERNNQVKPNETGPIYGVKLIDTLPLGTGGMLQELPNRDDLEYVRKHSLRTVAGYEVLLRHYKNAIQRVDELESEVIRLKLELSNKSIDADENAYHMREDSDQTSRSGLHFTHGEDR